MIDPPEITKTTAQRTAVIRVTIPRAQIRNVVGPGLHELMAALADQGIPPSGAWFTHHFRMDPDTFDFEIGVPVSGVIAAHGRVEPSELPAATVARAVYHGGYEGLSTAWREFDAWITGQGHTPAANLWECYVAGPESSPDPNTWRTQLSRPLLA